MAERAGVEPTVRFAAFAAIEGTRAHRSPLRLSVLLALISYFTTRIGSTCTDWSARYILQVFARATISIGESSLRIQSRSFPSKLHETFTFTFKLTCVQPSESRRSVLMVDLSVVRLLS